MFMTEEYLREGEIIYQEGKIEIRTFPGGIDEHNIYIGDNYFLFPRGILKELSETTSQREIITKLNAFNPCIFSALKQNNLTSETLRTSFQKAETLEAKAREKYIASLTFG